MNQPPLNPDALEAATRAVSLAEREMHTNESLGKQRHIARRAVSAYLAAALPEVTEREQLTALSDKVVLEDRRGTLWQKINGTWYTPGSKHDYSDQSVMLPARVRHCPEVKP